MGKIRRYKNSVEKFLSGEYGQWFFNICYSIGAAIVILGALFKILHLPGGNLLLCIGMGTEVLMFILTAFDRPPREYRWEDVFPILETRNPDDKPDFSGSNNTVVVTGGTSSPIVGATGDHNSVVRPYVRLYFNHGGYNDYPVVGVSWDQANAFCNWRTDFLKRSLGKEGVRIEPYRLPTESEWEYAARAGNSSNKYPWEGDLPLTDDSRGCFYANFKPGDGNYSQDGQLITSKVGTYAPNDFGLYDMAGNVSEWTSTAYTESVSKLKNDLNPEYRYNAAIEDPYKLKRKIIRGGSWKDVAHNVRSDLRQWEYENEQRSYIGFRCVRSQIGFAKGNGTRRR